ncbi:ferritin-like domain-containing protein [Nocardioides terrisoli]|uniref:ferritin-like domain-containing protein n=1 Tax=Nocardioides terrisoli TaxID=3388267 RepID=UPI00287B8A6B|nr:ferritin-like domain-containing protein [Nocardioides marmorisolisilvae]
MTPREALQATLAGEHAAVYLYGVMGGQVSRSQQPGLADLVAHSYDTHRTRRDRLTVLVSNAGGVPVASAAAYRLPNDLATPADVRTAARQVEARCVVLYGQLVANSTGATRAWAISALEAAAVEQLGYGATPSHFPGMQGPIQG